MRALPAGWRRILLAAALAGTVAVAVAVSGPGSGETAVVAPGARKTQWSEESSAVKSTPPAGGTALLALEPRRFDNEPAEVFKVVRPPPPVAARPAQAEERPAAPPLPFKYLGRMDEGETSVLLLSFQGQDIMARTGETVGGRYRVDEIAEASIRFTYLPLNEQQTLKIGERN